MCSERHAFQHLVIGPFHDVFAHQAEKMILGVPDSFKRALITLPHYISPRIDVAVHIRNQFHHFENEIDTNDPAYKKEVMEFLNSTECTQMFDSLESEIVYKLRECNVGEKSPSSNIIYVAADNGDVKLAFIRQLANSKEVAVYSPYFMHIDNDKIIHIKDKEKFRDTNNTAAVTLTFDWYAMSLSNIILAWRRAFTNGISSFVMTAQKMSGTTDRSDTPGGVGTRGYQLLKNRHGHTRFEQFWSYSILSDYGR